MKRLWQIGNIVSLVFALVANYVVAAQVLNLPAINEVSDKYATLLTPATYAFAIWSVIYTLLVVFVIYQARDIFRPNRYNDLPEKIGPYFIAASIFNGLWTYVFVNELIGFSVIIILLLTVSLYVLLWKLNIATYDARKSVIVCVWWPLMLYTGWVTAASVVAVASWVKSLGFEVSPIAATIVLALLTIGLLLLLAERNARELVLASTWAIIAVGVQQMHSNGDHLVMLTSWTVSVILLVATAFHAYVNRQTNILTKLIK